MKSRKANRPPLSERIETSFASEAARVCKEGGAVLALIRMHPPEGLSEDFFKSFLPPDADVGDKRSIANTRSTVARYARDANGIRRVEIGGESVTVIARSTLDRLVAEYRSPEPKLSSYIGAEAVRTVEVILANSRPRDESFGSGLEPASGPRPDALLGDCLEYPHSAADIPSAHAASL